MRLRLVVPDRGAAAPSGGDRYDAAVAAAWRRRGLGQLDVVPVPGRWPRPSSEDLAALQVALHGQGPVVLDGLLGCAAPEVVERYAASRPVVILLHSLLADGAGAVGGEAQRWDEREGRALAACRAVVVTSRFAARQVHDRHGLQLPRVAVARPGTEPAEVSAGSATGLHLLTLGAVTPAKNHDLLLRALAATEDDRWRVSVVGEGAPAQVETLRRQAARLGLAEQVRWVGPLTGAALERVWAQTDLLVHPSRSETYGLVVTEAHARGIPTLVGAGTGAVEALAGGREDPGEGAQQEDPGAAVDVEHPAELASRLRCWAAEPMLRERWRVAARHRREHLRGWDATADELREILAKVA